MNAVVTARLALAFQRFTELPEHRPGFFDMARRRSWEFWSKSQALGVVIQ